MGDAPSSAALAEAEAYLASSAQRTSVAIAALAHVAPRVAELMAARDASEVRVSAAQADAAAALKDFKLVASRMVQDREATVLGLKRQLAAAQGVGVAVDTGCGGGAATAGSSNGSGSGTAVV